MKCCAVQNNQGPARGISGLRPDCTATLVGFYIGDKMAQIKLTQGKYAIVDDELYEWLNQSKWYVHKGHKTFYARRYINFNGKYLKQYMHRLILGISKKNEITDHINCNGLDNRMNNIRKCTHSQNLQNQAISKKISKSSKYKGVCWDKRGRKWQSNITFNHKLLHLGYYISERDAALAYDKKAKELFGEFARPNFS